MTDPDDFDSAAFADFLHDGLALALFAALVLIIFRRTLFFWSSP